MLFNSYSFLFVFLPVVLLVYWRLPSVTARKAWCVAASYVFYGAWSAKFAVLMLATTSVDYFTAQWIEDSRDKRHRRLWLAVSMAANLGVLGLFKYYNFFASSLDRLLPVSLLPAIEVILPIGISFYTFESMSYTIDVYRGQVTALRRFVDYAHFVTMFPRLVAGPIVRYAQMAEQLRSIPRRFPLENAVEAAHFFIIGLAKKILVADTISARLVTPLFADAGGLQFVSGWAAALSYTAQLYMDFSGYSDMAVGLGLLLGFRFPRNFNLPYRADNISEFWRRWHISLSSWLRDYLYIPLGGNRHGPARTRINLMVTMLLGGLWHGAHWNFVVWGGFHGAALLAYNLLPQGKWRPPRPLAVGATFLMVVFGWVMFRAGSVREALGIYGAMLGRNGLGLSWPAGHHGALLVLAGALAAAFTVDTYDWRPRQRVGWAILYGLIFIACVLQLAAPSPFLYFQF